MLALIVFAILFFAIRKFVVPNFEKTFAERTQAIEGGLSAAETKQAEADAKLAELEKQLADARHEAARIREEAREQGAQIVAEMREQAQAEATRIVDHGKTQIEAERQQAVTSLRAEVGSPGDRPRRSHRRREPGRRGSPEPRGRALPRRPRERRLDQHRERGQLMAIALRGASADALAALTSELESTLRGRRGREPHRRRPVHGLVGCCAPSRRLRRVATDVSVDAAAKAGLVSEIFGGKVDQVSLDLLASAVGRRWTVSRDLADVLEHLSEVAIVRSAGDDSGRLADELFALRPGRQRQPRRCATRCPTRSRSQDDKAALVRALLEGKALPATVTLAQQSLAGTYRTVAVALGDVPAGRRHRCTASASPPCGSPTRCPTTSASDSATRCRASTTGRSTSTWWSTPTSSVASGSRSVTTSSTAPSSNRLDEARRKLAG